MEDLLLGFYVLNFVFGLVALLVGIVMGAYVYGDGFDGRKLDLLYLKNEILDLEFKKVLGLLFLCLLALFVIPIATAIFFTVIYLAYKLGWIMGQLNELTLRELIENIKRRSK